MKVEEGESVAITGPSGCGKTTLSKLLLALYRVKEGEIKIGGCSYYELFGSAVRKRQRAELDEKIIIITEQMFAGRV